jgi:antitoxin component HigA of HigAB toxin-antitoxin module
VTPRSARRARDEAKAQAIAYVHRLVDGIGENSNVGVLMAIKAAVQEAPECAYLLAEAEARVAAVERRHG